MQIILLSGGSGKRLWPLSNNERSKQFLPLLDKPGGGKESMVQRVVRQIREAGLDADITLATNASQERIIRSQLGGDIPLVLEPERRDTFPAIALACAYLSLAKGCDDDQTVIVMPCDPYTEAGYFATLARMAEAVEQDAARLVLMGIKPTYPSSKYGYIVPRKGEGPVFQVSRFTEKPTVEMAVELLDDGAFWNGGVFGFRLGYLMEKVRRYIPETVFSAVLARYADFPKISFDYAVAEKEASVAVIPYEGEWKDLGTWNTLTDELSEPVTGKGVLGEENENVRIINELDIPIFADGLKDIIIAASADGILVCHRKQSENIKKYVEKL